MIKSANELDSFLENVDPIIVLDSSVILDLYKYAPEITENLLIILEEDIKTKIWLPGQVLEEFNNNHEKIYNRQFSSFENVPADIENKIKRFKEDSGKLIFEAKKFYHPHIDQLQNDIESKINEIIKIKDDYLQNIKADFTERKRYQIENKPLKFVESLIESKQIGEGFNKFEKFSIYNEGELRYKLSIPPGFKDENNKTDKNDPSNMKKFGDLIIWKEILEKCKKDTRGILFVTGDLKEDWWELDNTNEIVGKHESLNEEFEFVSGLSKSKFEMLPKGTFFNLISNRVKSKSYEEALERLIAIYSVDDESILSDTTTFDDIGEEINNKLNLEHNFANEGMLQDLIREVITDVEVSSVDNVEFIEHSVYNSDGNLTIVFLGNATCETDIYLKAFDNEEVHYKYQVLIEFHLNINIPVKEELVVDGDLSTNIQSDYEKDDLLYYDDLSTIFSGLKIIDIHEIESPFNEDESEGQPCPDCGNKFPEGFFGPFCDNCMPNH